MHKENNLSKILIVLITLALLFSTTGCGVKLVTSVEPTDKQEEPTTQEETKEENTNTINTSANTEDTFGIEEKPDEEKPDEKNEVNNASNSQTSTTQNQGIADGSNADPSQKTINGIKFRLLDTPEAKYINEEVVTAYSNATMTKKGESLIINQEVSVTAYSLDETVAQIKTSNDRVYYVDVDYLSTNPVKIITQPAPSNNNNNNSNSNNNNGSNNNNNNYSNSGNSGSSGSSNYTPPQQTAPVCRGICYPGGAADTTISGIGCKYSNFTAYITETTYIYASPDGSQRMEWLAAGEALNCTAICTNNYVQVLLANGQYVYISGEYLTR